VPNAANPQDFNRYSYVRNNPVRYTDPTGHVCTDPEDPTPTCYGSGTTRVGDRMIRGNHAELGKAKTLPMVKKPAIKPNGGGSGFGERYEGPLPEDIVDILVAQGADAEMLDDVVIKTDPSDLYWQLSCAGSFNKDIIARTNSNNIYWCLGEYFSPDVPTPVLLHELDHVANYGKYPNDVAKEQRRTFMFAVRDMIGGLLFDNWQDYDPYESSWVEVQGAKCEIAFANDSNIRLDRPPCNIWINLP